MLADEYELKQTAINLFEPAMNGEKGKGCAEERFNLKQMLPAS